MNAMTENPSCVSAALEYAARGWHVFPAPPGEKKSYKSAEYSGGRNWGQTTDPDEIRRDFARWPMANVGIATGPQSGFFVIEGDRKNGVDGVAWLAERIEESGEPWPSTVEALSPGDSWHVCFRYPEGWDVRTCEGLIAPGVDVRGHGGMVLAAPSVKPGAAKPYRWKNPPGFFEVAECPAWLLAKVPRREEPTPSGQDGPRSYSPKPAGHYADLLHKMSVDGFKHGAVRDFAAGLAGMGVPEKLTRALIAHHCPVSDANVENSIVSAYAKYHRAPATTSDPAPVDLWGTFPPPDMIHGLLPSEIEDFAEAQGERMGADPAGLAVAALVTCAAAITDAIKLQVKRHDPHWTESARLWAAVVGSPSTRKSPILSAATAPLRRLDTGMFRDWQRRKAEWDALPKEEKALKPPPAQTRLRIEDATIEAAQGVLEASPAGVLMLQDELSGFFGAMDKYSGGNAAKADRGFWLRSFNGGEFALNRVGRGSALIPNLSVCLLGGIQPEPMRKIAADAHDDGLLQRLFPVILKPATMGRDEPAPDVVASYAAMVEDLHRLRPPGGLGMDVLHFDDGAQAIRRELEEKHLTLQSSEAVSRKLAAHIGKYDGLFARLCVVWHCIENRAPDLPQIVTEATARRVADFLHLFLLPHAVAFYGGVLGLSDDHDRLTAIAGFILAHKLERVTHRDVQRGDRTMRAIKDADIRPLLEQLSALGWLERIEGPRPSSQPHWNVNPAVHARFAERAKLENVRRTEARAALAGMLGGRSE